MKKGKQVKTKGEVHVGRIRRKGKRKTREDQKKNNRMEKSKKEQK